MKYKYCTKAMVDKAVKQGREAVIKCASDKWWFFGTCSKGGYWPRRYDLSNNCSLCAMFLGNDTCPLRPGLATCTGQCNEIFWEISNISIAYDCNPTATNFKKFQAKARKLARVIGRLK
jgi:hypothetical protein